MEITVASKQEMKRAQTKDNGRNGEKCPDSNCILEGDTGLTSESDVVSKGKGITQKNALGFWLKHRDGVI